MRKEHRRVANTPRVERTERLEGSRFTRWQLYGLLAGGSRERLDVRQFYGPVVSAARNRRDGQNIVRGHSREPPVFTRFGRLTLRQDSRGRRDTRQSGPPDVASRSLDDGAKSGSPPGIAYRINVPPQNRARARLRNCPLLHPQQLPLPIHQHLRRRRRLAGDCLEDTARRDDRWIQIQLI
jgi:hypothetical protein